jgi:hypothetical protein
VLGGLPFHFIVTDRLRRDSLVRILQGYMYGHRHECVGAGCVHGHVGPYHGDNFGKRPLQNQMPGSR